MGKNTCEAKFYKNSGFMTEKDKKILNKLYIDIVRKHEVGIRDDDETKNFRNKENSNKLCNITLYTKDEKVIDIDERFIDEIESIGNSTSYKIKNNILVFYKYKEGSLIYLNICDNERYCFLTKDFKKKEVSDKLFCNNKKYQWVYAKKFEEINEEDEQKKIIEENKLFFYTTKETEKLESNQFAIYIDADNVIKFNGSKDIKKKVQEYIDKDNKNKFKIYDKQLRSGVSIITDKSNNKIKADEIENILDLFKNSEFFTEEEKTAFYFYNKEDNFIKGSKLYIYTYENNKKTEKLELKSNQFAIYIDDDNKIKFDGSKYIKEKVQKYINKNNKNEFKICDKQTKSDVCIITDKSDKAIEADKIEKILNLFKNSESFTKEKETDFHLFDKSKSKLHIYTYNNIIYCSKITIFKPQGIYITNDKKNIKRYFPNKEENERGSKIHSICFINQNSQIILYDNKKRKNSYLSNINSLKKEFLIKKIKINIFYDSKAEIKKEKTSQNCINMLEYTNKYKNDYIMILAGLRNAIAHARVTLENNYIIFKNSHWKKVNLLAKIHKDKICDFIDELNKKIDNS